MITFAERLRAVQRQQNSLLCIGLDPVRDRVVAAVGELSNPTLSFNRAIIDATADLVCAYKLNLAFYEAMGTTGLEAMVETVKHVPRPVIVIGDAKRGDVGHTSQAYAQALYDGWGFDAVTLSPYLGRDSLQPFLNRSDRGAFVLCRTSNPGARDFQDLLICRPGGEPTRLYLAVAHSVMDWNAAGNCGLVVGATYPKEIEEVREVAPSLPLLIPGVGAQAGDLEAAVRAGVDAAGYLAVVNSSRQVIYASADASFATAARRVAAELRDQMNRARLSRPTDKGSY